MSHLDHQDIRIGTLAGLVGSPDYLRQILPHGFESFELTLWQYVPDDLDPFGLGASRIALDVKDGCCNVVKYKRNHIPYHHNKDRTQAGCMRK